MTDKLLIDRELLEQICVELEHDNDRYMLGRELRKALAQPGAPAEVPCDCGDLYPADSFGAGFIAALGRCPNCQAAEDAVANDDLHVWRATTRFGETCHFGEASTARAWAGENGTVERVDLTPVPELRVVERQEVEK